MEYLNESRVENRVCVARQYERERFVLERKIQSAGLPRDINFNFAV